MSANRLQRGVSLVEVMAAIAILGIASLGLVGGVIVALSSNASAGRRSQMRAFAQSRIERLIATRPAVIPCGTLGALNYDARMDAGGLFDEHAAPGTGGWRIDSLDTSGDADSMSGPLLVDATAMTGSDDHAARGLAANTTMLGLADGDVLKRCSNPAIANDPAMLCRELHIEQTIINGAPIYRVWVRVLQGGAPLLAALIMQEDIAQ